MFGFWTRRKPLIHAQWYVPILDKQSDTEAFYTSVEEEIRKRNFPGVFVERIHFREGGWLSANRAYLRITRERAVLDVCSADFGSGWFFTCRAALIFWTLRVWELVVVLLTIGSFAYLYLSIFTPLVGQIALGGTCLAPILLCLLAGSWPGLDAYLMRVPVLGAIYESFFRRLTYYRIDTQRMFLEVADRIVREQALLFSQAMGETKPHFIDVYESEHMHGLRKLSKDVLADVVSHYRMEP